MAQWGRFGNPPLSPAETCTRGFCSAFFFGGLLFVLESSLSLFIWLGRISILLPFTSIKTACQVTGFDDGVTFSACRKPIHFLVFEGGGSAKLLLMKNKASNSTGDITVNQKITVVLWVSFLFFNYAE